MRYFLLAGAASSLLITSSLQASAHHVADGRAPGLPLEGLLSGLSHPVIGIDHLAFIVVVGLVAALRPEGLRLIVSFGAAVLAGVLAKLGLPELAHAELLVALSVLAAGVALVMQRGLGSPLWSTFALVSGALHGYTLGGAVVGSPGAAVAFFLIGLTLSLGLIVAPVIAFAELALSEGRAEELKVQAAGGAVTALGVFFVASAITA